MPLFNLLNINAASLNSFQKGIDLVNKNINNVNNKDYAKERANFAELAPYGVTLKEAYRVFDQRYFDRYLHENQKFHYYDEAASSLESVESIFNDVLGSGMAEDFNEYFKAVNDIVNEPDNIAARRTFIEKARVLVAKFHNAYDSIENDKNNLQLSMQTEAEEINRLSKQLALLNKKIAGQPKNLIPEQEKLNSLLNERDKVLKKLSSHIDVQVRYNANNTADVFSAKGHALVLADRSYEITLQKSAKELGNGLQTFSTQVLIDGVELTGDFSKGSFAAKLHTEKFLDQTLTKLNTLVNTFATKNNDILTQAGSYDYEGNSPGKALFVATDGGDINLANIAVNDIRPEEIAAAKSDAASDNANIKELYALKDTPMSELDGKTFENYYISFVADIGNERNKFRAMAHDSEAMVNALDDKLQEISGVNLDEELVNLTQLQRSYEAAARVISVTDKLLETVMNMIR